MFRSAPHPNYSAFFARGRLGFRAALPLALSQRESSFGLRFTQMISSPYSTNVGLSSAVAGIARPAAFISAFFSGSLLIETIFSLDGLGLLSFESIEKRDYPVVFASLYIFSLIGLFVGILSDFAYTMIDPRIDVETREV